MSFSKWYPLCELITIKYGKNQSKVIDDQGAYPIYGTGGLMGYANSYLYNKPSVLIGRKGSISKVRYVEHPFWTVDTLFYTIINESRVLPKYIYYRLSLIDFNYYNEGTTIPSLRTDTLNRIEVDIPPLPEQKTIVDTLSCLDDKIELNNSMNKTLEEMAQAIFKSWFVDFEPFQNEEFEDSELGRIPKGWRVGVLDDIIDLFDSKRIPLSSRKRENMEKIYPYYGATSLMDYVDDYIFDGIYVLLGEDGTVVDSKGYPILQYVWGKFWVNNHAHILKGKNGFNEDSIYMILKNTNVQGIVTGAVQLKINQANLKSVKVIIPTSEAIEKYNYLLEPLFSQKRRVLDENQMLTEVRDTLLPKLMSGEIRIPIEEVK